MTLLIRNAQILKGDFTSKGDCLISNGKISAIGNISAKIADQTLDAQGGFLAPGFLDIHSEADHHLTFLNNRQQAESLSQGVTGIILGQDGISLAPVLTPSRLPLGARGHNTNWQNIRELLEFFHNRPLGVNVGTLVGYENLREFAVIKSGKVKFSEIIFHLENSLDQGALGLSIDFNRTGQDLNYLELKRIGRILASRNKLLVLDLPDDSDSALTKNIWRLLQETQVKVLCDNLISRISQEANWQNLWDGGRISVEVPVLNLVLRPLSRFLPQWIQSKPFSEIREMLRDDWIRRRIRKELPRLDPESFRILRANYNESLLGLSLGDIMRHTSVSEPQEALLTLLTQTDLSAIVGCQAVETGMLPEYFGHPHAIIGSQSLAAAPEDWLQTAVSPHTTQTFTEFLGQTAGKNLLPLETAIRKISRQPAQLLGLVKTGDIAEGYSADLTCFRWRDTDQGKYPEILFTLVAGKITWQNGQQLAAKAGQVLRQT